jgi:predicted dehydrogenase
MGKMGIMHSGILSSIPGVCVKAICEKETILVKLGRKLLPETVSFYKNEGEMLEREEIDAVFVTTPIDTHVPLILRLSQADNQISLFVEKPLAVSGEEARNACQGVRGLHGVYMVGFQKRFSPTFQKAREFIADGSIGDGICFRASTFSSDVLREGGSWRFRKQSGGVLLDLAPHLLDLLLWFFGQPISVSSVQKKRMYSKKVDDYVRAEMSYKSGLEGFVEACWSMKGYRLPETTIEVKGRNGTLTVTDDTLRIESRREAGDICEPRVFNKQFFDTSVPFLLGDFEYTREDQEFLNCIEKKTNPGTEFSEATKVNDLIDQIDRAWQESGEP